MRYQNKSFQHAVTVKKIKRDCAVLNHWPVQRDDAFTCWFCKKPCTSDGKDCPAPPKEATT